MTQDTDADLDVEIVTKHFWENCCLEFSEHLRLGHISSGSLDYRVWTANPPSFIVLAYCPFCGAKL